MSQSKILKLSITMAQNLYQKNLINQLLKCLKMLRMKS